MGSLIMAAPSKSVTVLTSNQFSKSKEASIRQARPLSPTRVREMLPFWPNGARKWGATSWRREFRCQRCSGPARTLQLLDGLCLCRKCAPLPTQHHIHKNATAWANEDGLADAIIRLTLKQPTNARRHRKRRLVARLTENTLANASNVLTNVQALIVAVDSLPEWVGTTR